jgi:large subunit ribosomal protein L6
MFTLSGSTLRVEGPQGAVSRPFPSEALELTIHPTKVDLRLKIPTNRKRAQALLHTWERHITNLAIGVTRGFEARMKVVAAHFPMKVQVRDSVLVIENFLGEKHARNASLIPGVKAQVEGEFVLLSGHDIEEVGQSAANIERATKIRDYDPRVFQDGIYIVERARPKETGS